MILMIRKLNWSSLVNIPVYGYTETSKNIMLALSEKDVDLYYRYVYGPGTFWDVNEPIEGLHPKINQFRLKSPHLDEPEVVYATADMFSRNRGNYRIGYTMLEVDGINREWVRQCNQMDEVWVPSSFNQETFINSGVTTPIYVMPFGINPKIFNSNIISTRYSDEFTFLSVFQWSERKNPHQLIQSFWKAFKDKDDVVLVLKVSGYLKDLNFHPYLSSLGIPNWESKIILDDRRVQDHSMGKIYRAADAFISPTSGEGWGMTILEAMACGLPTIATCWGGQQEFFNEETGYPIRIKGLTPCPFSHNYYKGFRWAEPDFDHMIEQMLYVYENREIEKKRSEEIAKKIVTEWTWEKTAEKIISRFNHK